MKCQKGTDTSVLSQEIFEHDPLIKVDNPNVCCQVSERHRYFGLITRAL